jgi:predicted nucleotidyltransferase
LHPIQQTNRRAGRPILRCGPAAALRVIMNTMSEVAENATVLDGLVRRIAERFAPDKIILFGSRARGDAAAGSDIDLLVLFSEVADPNQRAAELYASLVDFPHPMDIVVSTSSRFERYRNVVNTVYWPASREGKTLYERAA